MSYRDIIKTGKIEPKRGKGGAGMHPKYTPEEFEELVCGYIDECNALKEIPTMMHFAMTIKISREQLYKYYGAKEEYADTYSTLLTCRDGILEHRAMNPEENERRSPTMMIFALKQIGWTDKQEIEQRTTHSVSSSLAERLAGGSLE